MLFDTHCKSSIDNITLIKADSLAGTSGEWQARFWLDPEVSLVHQGPKTLTLNRPLLFTILIQWGLILLITLSRLIDFHPSLFKAFRYRKAKQICRVQHEVSSQPNVVPLFLDAWAWNGSSFAREESMPNSCMSILLMSSEENQIVRLKKNHL